MASDWVTNTTMSVKFPKIGLDAKASRSARATAGAAFSKGIQKGMDVAKVEIRHALDESLETTMWGPFSPKYDYISKGGNLRTSGVRSLVDTGALQGSLTMNMSFLKTKGNIRISYNSPYAALTHYGGVIQPYGNMSIRGTVLPARPWVEYAMIGGGGFEPLNLSAAFAEGMAEHWS